MLKTIEINEKYSRDVENLLRELAEYPESLLNQKPFPGSWSALQAAWHLVLAEEHSLNYVQKKLHYGGKFKRTGFQAWVRFVVLYSGMKLPVKFRAPKPVSGAALPEHSTLEALAVQWRAVREKWTNFFAQLPENLTDKAVYKHHVVGRIGWADMLRFFRIHFNRHRAQIRRALSA